MKRKDKTAAGLLALFLGGFGVHKFYLGNAGMGILYLLFCWTLIPAFIGLIEGILLLTMNEQAFDAKYNNYMQPQPQRQPQQRPVNQQRVNPNMSVSEELEKLHGLKEKGVLTQEEFDLKKKQLLGL
jgi:TM2 domain-containing membrane protein YozV